MQVSPYQPGDICAFSRENGAKMARKEREVTAIEIEPWMLALYMACGVCFFVFLSVKITPRFAKRAILNGLKGEDGKAIMHEIVLTAIESLDDEISVEGAGPLDAAGKPTALQTTIGNLVMSRVSSSIIQHFKMTFLGERGNMTKEMKGAASALMLSQLPEQMQPFAAALEPMLRKYPVLGVVLALGSQMVQKQGGMSKLNASSGGAVPRF